MLPHEISHDELTLFLKKKINILDVKMQSYMNYFTNIYWLNKLYKNSFDQKKLEYQKSIYLEGVGTNAGEQDCMFAVAFGTGRKGILAKTDKSLCLLENCLNSIRDDLHLKFSDDKFLITRIQFDLFGFSRGAISASILARRIFFRESCFLSVINNSMNNYINCDTDISTRFIGLFDTVSGLFNSEENDPNYKSRDFEGLNFYLPPGVSKNIFHITASHECRENFPLHSLQPQWPEMSLPGTHSDIGGGYFPNLTENIHLTRPLSKLQPLGYYEGLVEYQNIIKHDLSSLNKIISLKPFLKNSTPFVKTWNDDALLLNNHGVLLSRQFFSISLSKRNVVNSWSIVSLKIMIEAAKDYGVDFKEIDSSIVQLKIPPELNYYYFKARKISFDIRNGIKSSCFTNDEIDFLASRYLHCSANWNFDAFNKAYDIIEPLRYLKFLNRPNAGWKREIHKMYA